MPTNMQCRPDFVGAVDRQAEAQREAEAEADRIQAAKQGAAQAQDDEPQSAPAPEPVNEPEEGDELPIAAEVVDTDASEDEAPEEVDTPV